MEFLPKQWLGALLAGLGIFSVCIGAVTHHRAKEAESWPIASGVVTKATIITSQSRRRSKSTRRKTRHLPEIQFIYSVGNVQIMHKQLYFSNSSPAQVIKKYPKGSKVAVTYNPQDVNDSFIEPPELSNSFVMYGLGGFLFAVGSSLLMAPLLWRTRKRRISEKSTSHDSSSGKPIEPSKPFQPARVQSRPVTIGDVSALIGQDVRELMLDGWTDRQIQLLVDQKLADRQ